MTGRGMETAGVIKLFLLIGFFCAVYVEFRDGPVESFARAGLDDIYVTCLTGADHQAEFPLVGHAQARLAVNPVQHAALRITI